LEISCEKFLRKKQKFFLTLLCCAAFPASFCLLVFTGSYQKQGDMLPNFSHTTQQKLPKSVGNIHFPFSSYSSIVASPREVPLRLAFYLYFSAIVILFSASRLVAYTLGV
jgi:hypothetical protein